MSLISAPDIRRVVRRGPRCKSRTCSGTQFLFSLPRPSLQVLLLSISGGDSGTARGRPKLGRKFLASRFWNQWVRNAALALSSCQLYRKWPKDGHQCKGVARAHELRSLFRGALGVTRRIRAVLCRLVGVGAPSGVRGTPRYKPTPPTPLTLAPRLSGSYTVQPRRHPARTTPGRAESHSKRGPRATVDPPCVQQPPKGHAFVCLSRPPSATRPPPSLRLPPQLPRAVCVALGRIARPIQPNPTHPTPPHPTPPQPTPPQSLALCVPASSQLLPLPASSQLLPLPAPARPTLPARTMPVRSTKRSGGGGGGRTGGGASARRRGKRLRRDRKPKHGTDTEIAFRSGEEKKGSMRFNTGGTMVRLVR